jgi:hypothetical protein
VSHDEDDREDDEDNALVGSAPRIPDRLRGWKQRLAIVIALIITIGGVASVNELPNSRPKADRQERSR